MNPTKQTRAHPLYRAWLTAPPDQYHAAAQHLADYAALRGVDFSLRVLAAACRMSLRRARRMLREECRYSRKSRAVTLRLLVEAHLGVAPESNRSHVLEACPNKANHTPQPDDYLEWHDWAERMTKTHRQIQCDGCQLWTIWVPK